MGRTQKENPLLELALAKARQGSLILPMGPFMWHKGTTQAKGGLCRFYDRLCTLSGWHVASLDMWEWSATTNETKIREWWAAWPKAYVGLIGLSLPGFAQVRPMFLNKPDRGKPKGKKWGRCLIVLDIVEGKPRIVHTEEIDIPEDRKWEAYFNQTPR